MNMLSAMLWAWTGVCVLSVLAAGVIVLAEVRMEQQDLAKAHARPASSMVGQSSPAAQAQLRPAGEPTAGEDRETVQ